MEATFFYLLMLQKIPVQSKRLWNNISKYVTVNNMKKTGLKGTVIFFSVDFNRIDTNNILDIHRCLKKGK